MITFTHSMSFQEWLSGFCLILDGFILFILAYYLIDKRHEIYKPHYCIASALWIYLIGHGVRAWVIWYTLFNDPEVTTQAQISAKHPIGGDPFWILGSIIAAVGLAKLMKTFGDNYYLGGYAWAVMLVTSAVFPLISFLM